MNYSYSVGTIFFECFFPVGRILRSQSRPWLFHAHEAICGSGFSQLGDVIFYLGVDELVLHYWLASAGKGQARI